MLNKTYCITLFYLPQHTHITMIPHFENHEISEYIFLFLCSLQIGRKSGPNVGMSSKTCKATLVYSWSVYF